MPKTETFTIDGSKSRWPESLDKTEITFQNVDDGDSVDAQLAFLKDQLPEDTDKAQQALRDFISVGFRNYVLNRLSGELASKDDNGNQKSASWTAKDCQAFVDGLDLLPNERRQGTSPKAQLKQAKAQAERANQERDQYRDFLVRTILDLPKSKQSARIEELQGAGMLPENFDLEAAAKELDAS